MITKVYAPTKYSETEFELKVAGQHFRKDARVFIGQGRDEVPVNHTNYRGTKLWCHVPVEFLEGREIGKKELVVVVVDGCASTFGRGFFLYFLE